MIFICRTDSFV